MNLDELNNLSLETAKDKFFDCCGAEKWARAMTAARPFADVGEMFEQAGEIWRNLQPRDWLEAFAAHPKIGAKKSASAQTAQSANWSRGEQSGVNNAEDSILSELREANRLYENRFGFIFIVCATGKTAAEMLEICRGRLNNSIETETEIAAEEQRKITEIRLKKLLEIE